MFLDFPELSGKWIQLLRELVPKLARVAAVWDPSTPSNLLRGAETAARTLRVDLFPLEALTAEDFTPAFRSAADRRADALMVLSSPMFYSARPQIVAGGGAPPAADDHAVPGVRRPRGADRLRAQHPGDVPAGGPDVMVKVLRGARPGDIPLELPARFELIVNRKTAASLGLTVPQSLLVRADRVVE